MRESPPVRSFYNQKGMTEPKQPHRIWNSERIHTKHLLCAHELKQVEIEDTNMLV